MRGAAGTGVPPAAATAPPNPSAGEVVQLLQRVGGAQGADDACRQAVQTLVGFMQQMGGKLLETVEAMEEPGKPSQDGVHVPVEQLPKPEDAAAAAAAAAAEAAAAAAAAGTTPAASAAAAAAPEATVVAALALPPAAAEPEGSAPMESDFEKAVQQATDERKRSRSPNAKLRKKGGGLPTQSQ